MNSGDTFENKNILREVANLIDDNSDVIYGDAIGIISKNKYYLKAKPLENLINYGMPFCHQSVFVRKNILSSNIFNLKYKILADFDLFRRMYFLELNFQYINLPISIYDYEGGFSYSNPLKCFKEKSEITGFNKNKYSYQIKYYLLKSKTFIMTLMPEFFIETLRRNRYKKFIVKP